MTDMKREQPSTPDWLERLTRWACIVVGALLVPASIVFTVRVPQFMPVVEAFAVLAWLAVVGGLAGYGLWRIRHG